MRKMKIEAEPGYSAPVVGGFTRTVSFQTAVLQPNSALFSGGSRICKRGVHKCQC